jgi:hypothetical protein
MKLETLKELHCHRATSCNEVTGISVYVCRSNAELEIAYSLEGNLSRIRLQPSSEAEDPVELWQHTCFEAFIAIEHQRAYHEFNFAPSREWRVHSFRAYRQRDAARSPNGFGSPIIDVRVAGYRLGLDVRIALASLSELHSASALRLGLSSIIEPCNGALSYWALCHPGAKPDFHHPKAFALRVPPPGDE